VGVVQTVARHPENGAALQGQCANDGDRIFQPARNLKAAMAEEAMVAKANANAAKEPVEGQHYA
jgi:hypothetical protein